MASVTRNCEWCQAEFVTGSSVKRFCNSACAARWRVKENGTAVTRDRVCEWCRAPYHSGDKRQTTCGRSCGMRLAWTKRSNRVDRTPRGCEWCGQEFEPTFYKRRFCTKACCGRWVVHANAERGNAVGRTCSACGSTFYGWHKRHAFCSSECKNRQKLCAQYGITCADYERMLQAQFGGCAICGRGQSRSSDDNLYIDHCHKTGRVRGLLCTACNAGLGQFQDDPKLLRRAARYLKLSEMEP
jgi:hypothetical protein